jgi:hypothetical protein
MIRLLILVASLAFSVVVVVSLLGHKRRRYVYAYDVQHPTSGVTIKNAYIGKTSSPLYYRDAQHRADKVWAWAIRGAIHPIWEADCGRVRLWFMEVWFILTRRPAFNVQWNKHNRNRIPPWEASRLYGGRTSPYRRTR